MSRMTLILWLLHVYVGVRLLPDLPFGVVGIAVGAIALLASAWLIPYGFKRRRTAVSGRARTLMWAGLVALGAFSTLFVLTALRDAGLVATLALAALFPGAIPVAGYVRWTAIGVPLLTVLLTLVGYANARRVARVRDVDVPIASLHPSLDGFTIAQITDLHVGPTIAREYVEAIVDAVNGLDADLVAITGDLVDGSVGQLSPHTAPLARIEARHGTYFVTGNHEYYSGVHAWIGELTRLGMTVLLNEHVVLDHDGAHVVVAGVTDPSAHHFDPSHRSDPARAIAGAPSSAIKLLLAHQPRSAAAAAKAGFDLQLSGHTHGGQFLPWTFFVRFQQPFTAGLARLGRLWVYTSRGTGYWGPPKRLGAPSEITRLRLVPA
ncbi:MAG TPA: metallophosphoesterase [Casimicrobiaceae bacterium]|jgi:predicted MPP superfamily phosphohydrolase|nr:metallophosphoesterase [Casimicrobiaceae bacterium]